MSYPTVQALTQARPQIPGEAVAILICDSPLHAEASARRLARQGVGSIVALGCDWEFAEIGVPVFAVAERVSDARMREQINPLIDHLHGRWVVWLWNGEFFVFPFGETRLIGDLTAFLSDERRQSLFCYAFDLYARDLPGSEQAPELAELCFDAEGYHAFPKEDQQLRVFGGLGWRFQELLPETMRQIGRTTLFRAERGVHLERGMVFGDPVYASVSCPWHNNPTGAVMSLRRTRQIMAHPNFPPLRERLVWRGTERFRWTSEQLLELGMIEPGQWF